MSDEPPAPGAYGNFQQTYFEECAELLDATYTHLSALESGEADTETVHALFRAVHSIKGGGGLFGLNRLVSFAHSLETLLDQLRADSTTLTAGVLKILLRGADMLADLIHAARTGKDLPAGTEDPLLHELAAAAGGPAPAQAEPGRQEEEAQALPQQHWRIQFIPLAGLYASANEPLLILRDLGRLGTLSIQADLSRIPDLTSFDPTQAYLSWTIDLVGATTQDRILDA